MIDFLAEYQRVFVGLHLFGMALGVGAATITDVLFFRFLKDYRISKKEDQVFGVLSGVVWAGLSIIFLSGLALYLPSAEALNQAPKFLVKMVVFCVVVVNGAFLNLMVSPKLVKVFFGPANHHVQELHYIRKLAFALGAVSITSWYSAFILGLLPRTLDIGFVPLLLMYVVLEVGAIVASQVMDKVFTRKRSA